MKEPRNVYCYVVRYDKFKAFFIRVCAYNLGHGYEKMIKELFHNNKIDNINYIKHLYTITNSNNYDNFKKGMAEARKKYLHYCFITKIYPTFQFYYLLLRCKYEFCGNCNIRKCKCDHDSLACPNSSILDNENKTE